jgi:hypothetical protein
MAANFAKRPMHADAATHTCAGAATVHDATSPETP